MTLLNKFLTIGVVLVFILSFIFGCEYGKGRIRCPVITTDTITRVDTIVHEISSSYPYYVDRPVMVVKRDTVLAKVDTISILENYFSKYVYRRKWENDTLKVTVLDTISQNRSIGNSFSYNIKIPFVTIINKQDNSINYSKYISLGLDIPIKNIKYSELYGLYNWKNGFIGLGYSSELKSFNLHIGATLLKIK